MLTVGYHGLGYICHLFSYCHSNVAVHYNACQLSQDSIEAMLPSAYMSCEHLSLQACLIIIVISAWQYHVNIHVL